MPIKSSRFDVDIITQSLSELSMRIKAGFSKVYSYYDYVAASADTLVYNIIGKGNVIAITVWIQDTAQIDNDLIYAVADGEVLGNWPVTWYRDYSSIIVPGTIVTMPTIDDVNFRYALVLQKVITFESYFYGYFQEAHGRTPLVRADAVVGVF